MPAAPIFLTMADVQATPQLYTQGLLAAMRESNHPYAVYVAPGAATYPTPEAARLRYPDATPPAPRTYRVIFYIDSDYGVETFAETVQAADPGEAWSKALTQAEASGGSSSGRPIRTEQWNAATEIETLDLTAIAEKAVKGEFPSAPPAPSAPAEPSLTLEPGDIGLAQASGYGIGPTSPTSGWRYFDPWGEPSAEVYTTQTTAWLAAVRAVEALPWSVGENGAQPLARFATQEEAADYIDTLAAGKVAAGAYYLVGPSDD